MHCPFCRHPDSRVIDSRETDEGQAIRRRRSCPECGRRFTTVETAVLAVVKRSGVTEPFSREKVISGVRRACQGRQVDDDALNLLAQQVEDSVRAAGSPEIPSHDVGLAILGRCASLTRWPTYGSRRSTGRFLPRTISRARLRRFARTATYQPTADRSRGARLPACLSPASGR
ncbi:transcriptional regulator NrdR [Mycobacterium tuberculosis]|nr:transcriptional regulator NrdR [Mycobacterium tuberculosis]